MFSEESISPKIVSKSTIPSPLPVAEPELPSGQVRLASAFYVERVPYEAQCYKEILQPGALIRIKAPRQMGKTSLMARILYQAQRAGISHSSVEFSTRRYGSFYKFESAIKVVLRENFSKAAATASS
jgi:hypothetical protein